MKNYVNLAKKIINTGTKKTSRQGGHTFSIFGEQLRFDVSEKFPLMTIKKVKFENIYHELIWFLRGDTNIKYLVDNDCNIWNGDAYRHFKENFKEALTINSKLKLRAKNEKTFIENIKNDDSFARKYGNLTKVYGYQWTKYNGFYNQIDYVLNNIYNNPDSRYHIVDAWNPEDIPTMALPPCHTLFQLYVDDGGRSLSLQMYQRSADVFLGVPYNIASYGLLLYMMAHVLNKKPKELIINLGDAHIYEEHLNAVNELITRSGTEAELPTLTIDQSHQHKDLYKNLTSIQLENIILENYNPLSYIKAPLIV